MKRIIVLIDGTWNSEDHGARTNVAKLHLPDIVAAHGRDGMPQIVLYHPGVGSTGGTLAHWLGGTLGLGLADDVQHVYARLAAIRERGDELILCGFSRGAYAVRALAGMIGRAGVHSGQATSAGGAWQAYRKQTDLEAQDVDRAVRCIAVWDTVGSYGVPAGIGLDAIGRYISWAVFGFHDTQIGRHVGIGLHALAIDEHRRPFVPTFWTERKGMAPLARVEQTWFAGAHSNVGGGLDATGLSDVALIWMIARMEALAAVGFDHDGLGKLLHPNETEAVDDSTRDWPIDHRFPHYRAVLSPDAVEHSAFSNAADPAFYNVNERVHWSVVEKRRRGSYLPPNLPPALAPEKIAVITNEEEVIYAGLGASPDRLPPNNMDRRPPAPRSF